MSASDTASSVRRVVEDENPAKAAIGGRRAANIYGGVILQEHLEDNRENYTRFVLLTPKSSVSNQGNKISLMVRLPHQPEGLRDALRPFVRRGIDLLKIEGRPWQYNFYLDLQAPASKSELQGALDEIGEQAEELRRLGQYFLISILDRK